LQISDCGLGEDPIRTRPHQFGSPTLIGDPDGDYGTGRELARMGTCSQLVFGQSAILNPQSAIRDPQSPLGDVLWW